MVLVSKATAFVCSSESLEEQSTFMRGVEDERRVAEATVTIVDLSTVGVDPFSSGIIKSSAASNGGVERCIFGSLEHVNMSDCDVDRLRGVEKASAERDLTGADWGVSLGEQTFGSDVADVEDNGGGSVESDVSMFIQTSPLGLPIAVHTGVE